MVGRKPIPLESGRLRISRRGRYGSFYTRVVITDFNGKIACKEQIETGIPDGRVRVLRRVFESVYQVLDRSQIPQTAILGRRGSFRSDR